jgi:hypothetical protein
MSLATTREPKRFSSPSVERAGVERVLTAPPLASGG